VGDLLPKHKLHCRRVNMQRSGTVGGERNPFELPIGYGPGVQKKLGSLDIPDKNCPERRVAGEVWRVEGGTRNSSMPITTSSRKEEMTSTSTGASNKANPISPDSETCDFESGKSEGIRRESKIWDMRSPSSETDTRRVVPEEEIVGAMLMSEESPYAITSAFSVRQYCG